MISIKDFTIIIPCISYQDVEVCVKKIRKVYKKIKIIVCLNKLNLKKNKDKNIKFIISKTKSIGGKRNIAVKACKTKYLAFLDSDAYPNKNWIESTFKILKKKDNLIIAGPHVDPLKQNKSEKIIGMVKKSFLITMKPALQKGNREKAQYVSFLPSVNWIFPKKIFYLFNKMDNKMLRNEDWDFIYKMKDTKFKMFYLPKTLVYHENSSISHFIKKRFKYGFHMWPILIKLNFENYYFFIPLIFTIFLISFPLTFFSDPYFFIYLSMLILYFLATLIESIRVCDKLNNFLKVFFTLLAGNISPGFGIFFGIFKFLKF